MEDNLIKPDVVLLTKNVMVPLAVPALRNKFGLATSGSKKKTKIVKSRKNKTAAPRQILHLSQNEDYEHEYSKKALQQIYLDYSYDSSINLNGESHKNCENPHNRKVELANFRDVSNNGEIEEKKSSLNFPVAAMTREILDSSYETISLTKSSRSLIICEKDEVKKNQAEERLHLENWKKDDKNALSREEEELKIFSNEIGHLAQESVTEIRRCISSKMSMKNFNVVDSERVELYQPTNNRNYECAIKYSWQDLENWVPPCEKKKIIESEKNSKKSTPEKPLDCEIKYSWQILGTAVQTSDVLIEIPPPKDEPTEPQNYPCTIKYSWQIIGAGTQVSFRESAKDSSRYEKDYWDGKILKTVKRSLEDETRRKYDRASDVGKCKIYYSVKTQTVAEKGLQTDTTDCRIKYSWQNLTKAYLTDKRP